MPQTSSRAMPVCRQAEFPGPETTCLSPDGVHVLRWVEPRSEADQHRLMITRLHHGPERELLSFPRHATVFWSPSGRRLAASNTWASDGSTVLLWTDLTREPDDLLEALAIQEGQRVARWNAHHLYLEATGWSAEGSLSLRLWGYGDPPHAIDHRYVYTVGTAFSRE